DVGAPLVADLPPALAGMVVLMVGHLHPELREHRPGPPGAVVAVVLVGVEVVLQEKTLAGAFPHIVAQDVPGFVEPPGPFAGLVVAGLDPGLVKAGQAGILAAAQVVILRVTTDGVIPKLLDRVLAEAATDVME